MRNPTGASVALDLRPGDKQVQTLVRSITKDPGPLRIAAAYVTGNAAALLGLPAKGSLKRLRLLCDPFSGNCDPASLTELSKRGAEVRCIPKLHAKVYASSTRAIVGSPNLSAAALKAGSKNATIEAAALLSDDASAKRVCAWFDRLYKGGDRWKDILRDEDRYAEILRSRTAKANAGGLLAKRGKGTKPTLSLLAALQNPERDLWREIVFSLIVDWENADEDERSTAVANRAGLGLSEESSYEFIVSPDKGHVRYYQRQRRAYGDGRGPVAIGLYVKARRGRVTEVADIDGEAGRLVSALPDGNRLFIYYEPTWIPISLGAKSLKPVVRALNAGLKAGRYKLKDTGRFIRAAELARLLPVNGSRAKL